MKNMNLKQIFFFTVKDRTECSAWQTEHYILTIESSPEWMGTLIEEEIEMGETREHAEIGDIPSTSATELEEIKKRMKELEEEATNLLTNPRTNSAKKVQTPVASEAISQQEVDSCFVFVGNVDYSCTTDAVQCHFQSCGTMNRVTILTNKFGEPKGYAYCQFFRG